MPRLVVRSITLPLSNLHPAADGLRIAHITDLHLRKWTGLLEQLQQTLVETEYDILVVTGDISDVPGDYRLSAELARRLFSPVDPPLGSFGVLGNHDHPLLGEQNLGITLLRNSARSFAAGDSMIHLIGVEQHIGRRASVHEAADSLTQTGLRIIMAHFPSTVYELSPGDGALMLSGHTHGGQIRLPLVGCVWPNDRIPRSMSWGMHSISGNMLYVSPGIGASWPIRARFLCPPEVSLITLRSVVGTEQIGDTAGTEEMECVRM